MKSKPFFDNVAVLTGASSGIGLHLALQLAGQGARLALAARNVGKLNEVAELARKREGQSLVVPTDVAEKPQCQRLVETTVNEYGRLVGISSYRGKFPSPNACGYGANKHAMAGLFDSLRVEVAVFQCVMKHLATIDSG
jgi:NADP-dependent 3-hydroxy acid dehydrogenase YdfG